MKVLFVVSGNKSEGPGAVVANQAQSLKDSRVDIQFYLIRGKSIRGYLSNVMKIRNFIKENAFDLIHAHGVSALVATLSFKKPLVVSLLGSELNESKYIKSLVKYLARNYWNHTIVKSEDMLSKIKAIQNSMWVSVIPNGVNLSIFKPAEKTEAKKKFQWDPSFKQILWLADTSRKSKNYALATKSIEILGRADVELKTVSFVEKESVPDYLNAADVLLLTSLWEGSPNIVKEAMSCNCPVVATDVGDIKWLFGAESGHFITNFDPADVAVKLRQALAFSVENKYTKGRERILALGLDSDSIAQRIINIYKRVIN